MLPQGVDLDLGRFDLASATAAEAPAAAGESIDLTPEAPPALAVDRERRLFWRQQATRVKDEVSARGEHV